MLFLQFLTLPWGRFTSTTPAQQNCTTAIISFPAQPAERIFLFVFNFSEGVKEKKKLEVGRKAKTLIEGTVTTFRFENLRQRYTTVGRSK